MSGARLVTTGIAAYGGASVTAKPVGVSNCASVVLLAIFGAVSCGKVLGLDTYRATPSPGSDAGQSATHRADGGAEAGPPRTCGSFQYLSAECGQCMAGSCCGESQACAADPGCSGQYACEVACAPDDIACLGKCYFGAAIDAKPFLDLGHCEAVNCAGACSQQCGRAARSPCQACLNDRCCEDKRAVWGDADAMALLVCRGSCAGFEDGCPCTGSGATLDAVRKLETCRNGPCADSCTFSTAAANWQCVPTITWPPRAPGTTELDLNFGVFDLSHAPVPDIAVRACLDPECTVVKASGRTDERGWVPLNMPAGIFVSAAFFDYLEIRDDSGEKKIVDTLYHTNAFVDPINLWWVGISQPLLAASLPAAAPKWDAQQTGLVAVNTISCGNGSEGVSVDVEGSPDLYVYYEDSSGRPITGAQSTGVGGLGVIVGVPPGRPTIEARVRDTGELLFQRPAVVRAGAWTVVFMQPAPR